VTDLTIGIVGGGQLARMMNEAATPLGLGVRLLAEAPQTAAAQVVPDATVGDYTDAATLSDFAADVTAVTFDHEHVPTGLLAELRGRRDPGSPRAYAPWSSPRTRPRCAPG
jgi:5-(carboxyamino)imidazole ribonucleotide synthase